MVDARGVRDDLALGKRADARADLGQRLVFGEREATRGRDRVRAERLDDRGCEVRGDGSAGRGGVREVEAEQWRDRLEPVAQG